MRQRAGAEVWQVSGGHIDVYIPPSFSHPHLLSHTGDVEFSDTPLHPSPSALPPPPSTWNLTSLSNSTFHATYHTLPDIENFTSQLAELHPDLVKLVSIGHSAEGREMIALEVSKDKAFQKRDGGVSGSELNAKKVGFVITGAQHAREVGLVAKYIANRTHRETVDRSFCRHVPGSCPSSRPL